MPDFTGDMESAGATVESLSGLILHDFDVCDLSDPGANSFNIDAAL